MWVGQQVYHLLVYHTWKRSVPRWAAARREGTVDRRRIVAAFQKGSPGLSRMESERWKVNEAEQFCLKPSHLCEAKPLTKYSERVSVPSGPRTTSSSSSDTAPSTNRANKAKGTQKPSRVRKQLLQRDRRLALLVSLLEKKVTTPEDQGQ